MPDGHGRPGLVLLVGLLLSAAVCAGVIVAWPDDDRTERTETAADAFAGFSTSVPGATGEPSSNDGLPDGFPEDFVPGLEGDDDGPVVSLFDGGAADAVAEVVSAAGGPTQFIELAIYPTYAFVAYRDPDQPGNIDQRQWRDGDVSDAEPNMIDDRVDASTEPALFTLEGLDLTLIPALAADAVTRYDVPVEVTHILIDRFLPFDERVLLRVYATPTDGRSGGGYVSYDTAGSFVKVCC
jgi:hypothetical protein